MQITVVYGTRPEAIKLGPVVQELRRRGVQPTILATGQHTTLLHGTPAETVVTPDVSFGLASDNDPLHYARVCEAALYAHWYAEGPDLVVVQGDTASAYAGALAATALEIPVAHVEAGVRTGDVEDPWPEERFRIAIDDLASWKYCATRDNGKNLGDSGAWVLGGGPPPYLITGNPGIDALYAHTPPSDVVEDRVLVTLHRRESFGEPLRAIVAGLVHAASRHHGLFFNWPTHPNPQVQAALPSGVPGNLIVRPAENPHCFALDLSTSRAVITDSGGVQEEAAALGVPCVVARDKTDRPESVDAGLARVIGRTEQGVLDGLNWALSFSTRPDPSHCFGDGHAAPRIVDHLLNCR